MKRILLIIGGLLLLGSFAGGQQPDAGYGVPGVPKKEMRVMSFNIRYYNNNVDKENGWDNRRQALPAMLDDVRPAVAGLQECSLIQKDYIIGECPRYKTLEFAIKRGEAGLKPHAYIDPVIYDSTRVRVVEWGAFWLSETPEEHSQSWGSKEPRTALWVHFKPIGRGKDFIFINTHLDHVSPEARQRGLDVILDRMAEINEKGLPMVMVGDLNCIMAKEGSLDRLPASGWKNTKDFAAVSDESNTFNGFGKSWTGTIDYIWLKGVRKCRRHMVVTKEYCDVRYISDHYPIFADIKF